MAEARGQHSHSFHLYQPATWLAGVEVDVPQGVWAGPAPEL